MEENKPRIGHETGDINVWSVGKVGIALGGVCVVTLILIWGMYRYLQGWQKISREPAHPAEVFPQPRLEEHPVLELKEIRDAEDEKLATYGWVDQSKGVVRIPIDRAIDLLAQRGLTARPASPPAAGGSTPTESGLGAK